MGAIKQRQCLSVAAVLIGLASALCFQCYQCRTTDAICVRAFTGCGALLSLFLAVVALDITRQSPADSHTVNTLLTQYLFNTFMGLYGFYARKVFQNLSKNVMQTQEEILLRDIIRPNEHTEFGRRHNFKDIHCRDDYRKQVPLTTYDYYIPYIRRIETEPACLQGVLSHSPVIYLAVTSGSTGRNKVIPIGKDLRSKGLFLYALIFDAISQRVGRPMLRTVKLGYRPLVTVSETGLTKAPISYHMQRNPGFSLIPAEVYDITNEHTALYAQAVLSLAEREVGNIQGFMSTLVWAFWRLIEQNWRQMCDDIEHGTINNNIQMDTNIRVIIEKALPAAPARASQLRAQFEQGMCGIFRRVWPQVRVLSMFSTGGFEHYAKVLMQEAFQGVPLASTHHGASEGVFGFQMQPRAQSPTDISYASFLPLFQEYIPVDKGESESETVFAEQLCIGKCYEVVSTSPMGLYRYRMGDVIKVIDFYNQCPIYEFQYRMGHVLNVFWEKTPENVVYDALRASCVQLALRLVDYTSTEDVSLLSVPEYAPNSECKHYVVFLEATRQDGTAARLTDDEKALVDRSLCSRMELYDTLRNKASIGPMHVIDVKPGTFSELRTQMLRAHNNSQLKMPRVIRDTSLLCQLLLSAHKEHVG